MKRALLTACLLSALGAPALAQTPMRLDPDGKWVPAEAPIDPASDAGVMQRARTQLAENRPRGALALLDSWLKRNAAQDKPETAEALLRRGDAKLALKDEYEALYDYERVIKEYPGTPQFITAIERELEIGLMYLNGLRKKFLGMRIDSATRIGEELLIRVQERVPNSQLAQRAAIELANYYYRARDLRMASEAYEIFLTNFPTSEYRQLAMQRRVFANIGRYKGPRYDASGLIEAQYLVRDFAQRYPQAAEQVGMTDALISRLDESAAAQMFEIASWYFVRKDSVSARYTLKRLILKHPDTIAATRAKEIFIERRWPIPEPPKPAPTEDAPGAKPEPSEATSETKPEAPATDAAAAPEAPAPKEAKP